MLRLPNGAELDDEQAAIAEHTNYKCVAHPTQWMVTLHEEPPKSKNPNWRRMPETRFSVCAACHEMVHTISRHDASYYLYENRRKNFPQAQAKLEKMKHA